MAAIAAKPMVSEKKPQKAKAKATPSLTAVPKPTAKSTITRHKFEGDTI